MVGSFMVDLVSRSPRLPKAGETISGGPFSIGCGGKGSNQAIAAARLGARIEALLAIGTDSFGDLLVESFKKEGIDTRNVIRRQQPTGVALIVVEDNSGENQIVIAPGANDTLTTADFDLASDSFKDTDCMLVQLEIPVSVVVHSIRWAHMNGLETILNPAPIKELPKELCPFVNYFIPNEHEASSFTGIKVDSIESAMMAARRIVGMGCKNAIITLGSRGAILADNEICVHLEGYKVSVKDTTGAGDAFNGAMATAISLGMNKMQAVRFANAAAALSVTKPGTSASMPTIAELEWFMSRVDQPQ